MYIERCTHGSERGLHKPTVVIRQGGVFLLYYMSVTGYKGAYVAVLIGGNTFKWKFIERDEEIISMLIQLESEFWSMVQSNTPPPLDGSDASAEFIGAQFPNSIPLTKIDLPMEAAALIHQYDAACEQLVYLTDQKQEAENLLKQMLGENEAGIIADRVITWKTITQERLDSKAVKAKHPRIYKRFAKIKLSRRFSIKAAS